MFKRLLFLFVFLGFGSFLLPGCFPGTNCSCSDQPPYLKVESLSAFFSRKPTAQIKPGESVRWYEVSDLVVNFTGSYYGYQLPAQTVGFLSTAYACDCIPPGYQGVKEKIKRLDVKTIYDFDDRRPAGTLLNDDVTVMTVSDAQSIQPKPLAEFIALPTPLKNVDRLLFLQINRQPAPNAKFAVEITLELENGQLFSTVTQDISIIR